MAVDAEWHHSRSSDLSSTPQLSEYGVIGCASTEAPSNNCPTLDPWNLIDWLRTHLTFHDMAIIINEHLNVQTRATENKNWKDWFRFRELQIIHTMCLDANNAVDAIQSVKKSHFNFYIYSKLRLKSSNKKTLESVSPWDKLRLSSK